MILGEIGPHGQCGRSLAVTARLELCDDARALSPGTDSAGGDRQEIHSLAFNPCGRQCLTAADAQAGWAWP